MTQRRLLSVDKSSRRQNPSVGTRPSHEDLNGGQYLMSHSLSVCSIELLEMRISTEISDNKIQTTKHPLCWWSDVPFSSLCILLLEFARSYDYPMQSFYGQARHTSLRPAPTRAQIYFFQMHLMLDCYFFTVNTFCVFLGSFVFFLWSFLVCVSIWFSRVVPCFSVAPYGAAFILLIVLLCGSIRFFCLTPYDPSV